jgi:hypothetical protein
MTMGGNPWYLIKILEFRCAVLSGNRGEGGEGTWFPDFFPKPAASKLPVGQQLCLQHPKIISNKKVLF